MLGMVTNFSYKNKGLEIETTYKNETRKEWFDVPDKFAESFADIKKGDEIDFKYETSNNKKIIIDLVIKKYTKENSHEYKDEQEKRSKSITLQAFGKIAAQLVLSSASSRSVEDTKTAYSDYMDYIEEDYKKRLGE